jgi:Ni,Fe-hydrogenase III large subunit
MNTYKKLRLDLEENEILILKQILEEYQGDKELRSYNELIEKVNNPKEIKHSQAKTEATEKATKARSDKAREKIKKAVFELERELMRGNIKKVSHFAISKKSGVHINTVKKYSYFVEMAQKEFNDTRRRTKE